jgi:hypothetical protein
LTENADQERRIADLEHLTRNGLSPIVLSLRLDVVEAKVDGLNAKVDNLSAKVDDRFDKLTGHMWRVAGFIVSVMMLAALIVSLVIQ